MNTDLQKVKIGFLVTALPQFYDTKYARENAHEILRHLESLNVEVLKAEGLVTSWQEAKVSAEKFKKENIDLLLILCGTFTLDDLLVTILEEIDVPLSPQHFAVHGRSIARHRRQRYR